MTDPNFPDRPDTPTFWRLSDLVRAFDAQSILGTQDEMWKALDAVGVDAKSVEYIATQRALRMLPSIGIGPEERAYIRVASATTVAWMEGFLAGRRFEAKED